MKKLVSLCIAVLFLAFSAKSFAEEESSLSTETSKRGVYLSFTGFAGGEVQESRRAALGGGARFGGGITEDIMLYADVRPLIIYQSASNQLIFLDSEAKVQYYFWKSMYANVGAGVATVFRTIPTYSAIDDMYKTGFAGSVGGGYEFRIERRLFVAPEVRVGVLRIGGLNFVTVEGGGSIGFHF